MNNGKRELFVQSWIWYRVIFLFDVLIGIVFLTSSFIRYIPYKRKGKKVFVWERKLQPVKRVNDKGSNFLSILRCYQTSNEKSLWLCCWSSFTKKEFVFAFFQVQTLAYLFWNSLYFSSWIFIIGMYSIQVECE